MCNPNRQARINRVRADILISGLKWLIHRSQANATLRDVELDAQMFPPEYANWINQPRLDQWGRLDTRANEEALKFWFSAFALGMEKRR
jgi:hypothetical protein